MRNLLLTTALVVPLGVGYAFAQQADEPAEEGDQIEVEIIEPEAAEATEADAAAEGAEEAVEETGDALGEAAEDSGEAVEGAVEDAEVEPESAGDAPAAESVSADVVVREQARNELRVDWITDATLHSPDGEIIGGIEDLILDGETGQPSAAIIGVGGFLGIGAKSIAVAWSQLQIDYDANQVTANLTRDEAEAAPEYVFRSQEVPPPDPAMNPVVDPALAPPPAAD